MNSSILIIDDDRDILKVLKANLELHAFNVDTAESWSTGKRKLAGAKPDLLILDLMLPDGDGIEICRHLRTLHPALPVIMLTAKDKVSDKVAGLECGADDYMVKPFETLELIARIQACLRRLTPPAEKRATIKDLTIDYKRRTVKIKNTEIVLTPKEYRLLCFLVSRKGAVVSREEIRPHLWTDSQIYSWSRVIDVHIQHLREKLGDHPDAPRYIITVPGVGYKIAEDEPDIRIPS